MPRRLRGGRHIQGGCPPPKITRGKCHEMFKPRLQPRYWPGRLSARMVRQAALLFNELSRCRCGYRSCRAIALRTNPRDLLRLAFRTTSFARAAEAGASRHPSALRARSKISVEGAVTARNDWRCEGWRLRPNPVQPPSPSPGANLEESCPWSTYHEHQSCPVAPGPHHRCPGFPHQHYRHHGASGVV